MRPTISFVRSSPAAFGAILVATNLAAAEPGDAQQPAPATPYGTLSPTTLFSGMTQCFTPDGRKGAPVKPPGQTLAVSGGPAVLQACGAALEMGMKLSFAASSMTGQKGQAGKKTSSSYSAPFFTRVSFAPNGRITLSLTKEMGFGTSDNWSPAKGLNQQNTGSSKLDFGGVALLARQDKLQYFFTANVSSELFSKSSSIITAATRDSHESVFGTSLGATYNVNQSFIVGAFAGITDTKDYLPVIGKPDTLQGTLGFKLEAIAQKRFVVDLPKIGEHPFFVSATVNMVTPIKRYAIDTYTKQPSFSEGLGVTTPLLLRPDIKIYGSVGGEFYQDPEIYSPLHGVTRPKPTFDIKAGIQAYINTR